MKNPIKYTEDTVFERMSPAQRERCVRAYGDYITRIAFLLKNPRRQKRLDHLREWDVRFTRELLKVLVKYIKYAKCQECL